MRVIVTTRARAFDREGVCTNKFLVENGEVLVWDSVSGYYTGNHRVSADSLIRIRKIADKMESQYRNGDGAQLQDGPYTKAKIELR